jgi:hypothetical protein
MTSCSRSPLFKWGYVILFSQIGFIISSCQRSPQFRKEEDYGRNDVVSRYPALKEGPVAQKIEAMGQPRKKVLVLNFLNATPLKQEQIGEFAANELKRGLFLTQRVLLPMDDKGELNTGDFVQGDQVKVAQLIREGRRSGMSVLVIGRISKVVFRQKGDDIGMFRQKQSLAAVEIESKIFDVQGGREIMAISRSGEASNNAVVALEGSKLESFDFRAELTRVATRQAVAGLIPDVIAAVEKMAWQGRIAKATGKKIYVSAGRASGLINGDILKVLTPGEDIYDTTSGAYLGRSQGQLKGTLEVVDFLGTDGAVAETHTGGNFREGDIVQLY